MKSKFVKGIITITLCSVLIFGNLGYASATVSGNSILGIEENGNGNSQIDYTESNTMPTENNDNTTPTNDTSTINPIGTNLESPVDSNDGVSGNSTDNGSSTINDSNSVSENGTVSGNSTVSENSITFTYEDDDKEVKVTVPEKTFENKEGTPKLVVNDIKDEQELEQVKEDVKEKLEDLDEQSNLQGLLAYDIHFEIDGEEIEPGEKTLVEMNFKEPVIPEGVSEEATVSVMHIDESENEKAVEVVANDVQDENAKVQDLRFSTGSFSTFTINWIVKSIPTETIINCIDEDGNVIADKILTLTDKELYSTNRNSITKSVTAIADDMIDKTTNKMFSRAVVVGKNNDQAKEIDNALKLTDEIQQINATRNNGSTQIIVSYSFSSGNNSIFHNLNNDNSKIYFIFKHDPAFVETIDTREDIDITMFDYDTSINTNKFEFGGYGNRHDSGYNRYYENNTNNFISNTLTDDFYPKFADGNDGNLKYLFDDTNNKTIYSNLSYLFVKNDKSYQYDSSKNFAHLDTDTGNFLVYEDTDRNADFLPFNEIGSNNPNYFFGMKLQASFNQLKNGQITLDNGNKENMVFRFSGDDDMWVFIDNVLVLDIGGIHQAINGEINFATGDVNIWRNSTNIQSTNLKDLFNLANKTGNFKDNTFADYTKHDLKMFYLERGAGDSNLKLDFNLETIPTNKVTLKKSISSDLEGIDYNSCSDNFYYYLWTKKTNENTFSQYRGKYKIGTTEMNTNSNNEIILKANEEAAFELDEGTKYYFEEININRNDYDQVNVDILDNSTIATIDNLGRAKLMNGTNPKEFEVGIDSNIHFINHAKGNKLYIKKVVKDNSTTHTNAIKIEFKNAESSGEFVTYEGKYKLNGDEIQLYQDDCILVKQGDVIEISGVPKNTSFKVTEVNIKDNNNSVTSHYAKPVYKDEGENTFEKVGGWDTVVTGEPWISVPATGKTKSGIDAKVLIENKLLIGKITINKNIVEANFVNGDPIFTFELENTETHVKYFKTVRFSETGTETVIFDNLPCGTYVVTEKNTLRYKFSTIIIDNGSVTINPDKSATVNLMGNTCEAELTFYNARKYSYNFSHTDQLINNFTIDEDGNVTAYSQNDNKTTTN